MLISEDTLRVVNYLQEFSNNTLRKRNDIEYILEIGATKSNPLLVKNIIFVGKSIWNLSKTFSRSQKDNQNLHRELENSFYELQMLLTSLIENIENSEIIDRFSNVYLSKSSGCLRNAIDLSHDLSKLKELISLMESQLKK